MKVPSNATLSQLRCIIPINVGCESPDAQRKTKPSSATVRRIRGSIGGGDTDGLSLFTYPTNYAFAVLPVVRKITPYLLRSRLAVVFLITNKIHAFLYLINTNFSCGNHGGYEGEILMRIELTNSTLVDHVVIGCSTHGVCDFSPFETRKWGRQDDE